MSEIFWLDNFEGECQGGFFVRNVDMKNHFNKVEESNKKVVGIKVTKDSNEIELILKDKE